jgi:hypothetical protein
VRTFRDTGSVRRNEQRLPFSLPRVLQVAVPFGIITTLAGDKLPPQGPGGWLKLVLIAVFSSALFSLLFERFTRNQVQQAQDRALSLITQLNDNDRRAAVSASKKGVPPEDPMIRSAAARLSRDELSRLMQSRLRDLLILSTLLAISCAFALMDHSGWWYLVAYAAVVLALVALRPRIVRRRLARLE